MQKARKSFGKNKQYLFYEKKNPRNNFGKTKNNDPSLDITIRKKMV